MSRHHDKPRDPHTLSLEAADTAPVSFIFELPFPLSSLDREPLVEISPVRFSGDVAPIESGYSLQGRLAYSGRLECSRCLVPYPFETDEEFSLVLYPHERGQSPERELGRDELDVYFYDDPEVPAGPIVEERIQMAVPMKPLCREDCRGLCVTCGADRNRGDCGCQTQTTDVRWEALSKLKKV
jgi:uncharacterized protein